MINQEWIKNRLELLKIKPLTEQEKTEYETKRHTYLGKKDRIESKIAKHQGMISHLQQELASSRPCITKGGAQIHLNYGGGCGIRGAVNLGRGSEGKGAC